MFADRVLSGMRPTGRMHIGHYHGALKNWVKLQEEYECLYFAADWHALTTHFDASETVAESVWEMIIDWLAAGINPSRATIFIQSRVPEHAELALLLGMITPVGWLERVPTYKEQQQKLTDHDLSNFGFLGYPVMQGADILIYRANMVPVGEDQVSHVELVREIARRFNHIYGRESGFEDKAKAAVKKLGAKKARRYAELRTAYQERGDAEALDAAREMLNDTQNLSLGDRERLFGYLEGSRRVILPEPEPLLTATPKVPGLDGQKMSKSYGNTILMREDPADVTKKIRKMQTDPARVHRDALAEGVALARVLSESLLKVGGGHVRAKLLAELRRRLVAVVVGALAVVGEGRPRERERHDERERKCDFPHRITIRGLLFFGLPRPVPYAERARVDEG